VSDVTLYAHWICPFATRVSFALHQRKIEHDVFDLPPTGVRPKDFELPPEFLANSPRREIPLVRVGDQYQADSIPILLWLETVCPAPGLLPRSTDQRRRVIERVQWLDDHVMKPTGGVYYGTEPDRVEWAAGALARGFSEVARWLDDDHWLAGSTPTLAEAIMIPIYVRLESLRPLGYNHPLPSRVDEHRRACTELDGWSSVAWSPDQHAEFVARFEKYREITARG